MELGGEEPRVRSQLDDLHEPVGREPGERQSAVAVPIEIAVVELVPVPMPFADHIAAVECARPRPRRQMHILGTETHRAALARGLVAGLRTAGGILPLGDERDRRMRREAVELGAVRALEPEHVPAVLDDRELHAEADAEVWDGVLASVTDRGDLAFDAALAETARHQDRIHAREQTRAALLDVGGLDEVDAHAGAGLHAGVGQRFVERDIGIADLHVLSDHRDVDLTGRVRLGIDHALP